ncbi:MAG: restriction endonuclease [Thermoproteota archaeon]|nr:restriction endonuclease [Thermoproteota archaeon]
MSFVNPSLLIHLLEKFDSGEPNFGFTDDEKLEILLRFLSEHGLSVKKNGQIEKTICNKIFVSLLAVKSGAGITEVCSKINWHDFEFFAAEILRHHGYAVYSNFRMKKPAREIDVVGIRSKTAMLIDCKHWKKNSSSAFVPVVERQKNRSIQFLKKSHFGAKKAFPVILTFLPVGFSSVNDVPIVSVNQLNSFLLDFDCNCQNFYFSEWS